MKAARKKSVPELRFPEFEGEWEEKAISEIATKVTDGTHDTPKPTESGTPFLTAIHVKDGFIDFENGYFLPESEHRKILARCNPEYGDLLMVNIGAGTANLAVVTVDFEFSLKNVALIKPNRSKIDPVFFSQSQRYNSKRLRHQLSSGVAQQFLSLSQIGKLKLSTATLPEQRKVASFLTAVDKRLEQLSKKKSLLEDYKKGAMQQLFTQTLRFKDQNGTPYPNWEEKTLGELGKITTGKTPSTSNKAAWIGDTMFVTPSDLKDDTKFQLDTSRHVNGEGLKLIPTNSIMFTCIASFGKMSIATKPCITNQQINSLSIKSKLNFEYIYYALQNLSPKIKATQANTPAPSNKASSNKCSYEPRYSVQRIHNTMHDFILKLCQQGVENEVIEFKEAKNSYDFDKLGKYFSAPIQRSQPTKPAGSMACLRHHRCQQRNHRYKLSQRHSSPNEPQRQSNKS